MNRRALLAGLLALAACSRADGPVDPVWGKEPCAHCRMLVGDKAHAAQASHDGERRYFDDLGCMVLWLEDRRFAGARAWARDAEDGRWVDARTARYSDGARTPMDFGLAAKKSGPLGWDEARARVMAKERQQ